jgi:hypothetical protein
MSGKNGVCAHEHHKEKETRNMMLLLKKVEMMDELERGMSIIVVRHHYGVNEPMIYFIQKN